MTALIPKTDFNHFEKLIGFTILYKENKIMEGIDYIYNGLGYITYSLCMADGAVQDTERQEVEDLIKEAAQKHSFHASFADGIFRLT